MNWVMVEVTKSKVTDVALNVLESEETPHLFNGTEKLEQAP